MRCGREKKPCDRLGFIGGTTNCGLLGTWDAYLSHGQLNASCWPEGVGRRGRLANPLLSQVCEEHLKQTWVALGVNIRTGWRLLGAHYLILLG